VATPFDNTTAEPTVATPFDNTTAEPTVPAPFDNTTAEPTVPAPTDNTTEHCAHYWRVCLMNISPVDCISSYQIGHHAFFKLNLSNVNKNISLHSAPQIISIITHNLQ
jgi:hypothetical protein